MTDPLDLLTPDDVCGLLKVTKDWLYDQVAQKNVPVQRIPGSRLLRFRREDLQAMLDGSYQAAVVRPGPIQVEESDPVEDFPMPRRLRA